MNRNANAIPASAALLLAIAASVHAQTVDDLIGAAASLLGEDGPAIVVGDTEYSLDTEAVRNVVAALESKPDAEVASGAKTTPPQPLALVGTILRDLQKRSGADFPDFRNALSLLPQDALDANAMHLLLRQFGVTLCPTEPGFVYGDTEVTLDVDALLVRGVDPDTIGAVLKFWPTLCAKFGVETPPSSFTQHAPKPVAPKAEPTPPPSTPQPTPAVKESAPPTPAEAPEAKRYEQVKTGRAYWREKVAKRKRPASADTWVPRLSKIFREAGIPEELVWVAEIESTMNPDAVSRSGAVGLFQLMPVTAEYLGLSVKPNDERRDPELNAKACAKYLRQLHKRFDSWPLALAAYNCGPTRVSKLCKARGRSFDAIVPDLPSETVFYVPRIYETILLRTGVDPETLPPPRELPGAKGASIKP